MLAQGSKSTFQVVDDGSWSVSLRPISPESWAKMNVMVHRGFFALLVREIRFLFEQSDIRMFNVGERKELNEPGDSRNGSLSSSPADPAGV
jgi:hypothetical protein